MALTLSSLVTNVKSAFQNHSGSIRNTTVALLVFGLNAVVQSEDFFQCPPDNFVFYASCFFIIPALFLFCRDDFSSQRILGPCSWMLLLRRSVQARSKTVLLLFVSKMALQQSSCGNRIPKFSVWVHVDFLGALAA